MRKPGGGRPPLEKKGDRRQNQGNRQRRIAGSPTDEQKWVKLSLRTIASRLRAQAHRIGRTTVGRLLRKLGFGLVANRKSLTGAVHPDRNRQFDYIRRVRQQFLQAGYPVISVDTKNKELIGNFANQGRTWRQAPEQVNLHDFPGDALGRAVPYGIYDIVHNQGYVYLGNSYDTPEFAAHAIAQWWADPARPRFQREDKILILCDAGGSNNPGSGKLNGNARTASASRFWSESDWRIIRLSSSLQSDNAQLGRQTFALFCHNAQLHPQHNHHDRLDRQSLSR